jgi:hypothetical protein
VKKVGLFILALTVVLCGCGKREEAAVRDLQRRWAEAEQITAQTEITFHLDGTARSFTVATVWEPQGATTTILAPEAVSGISATVSGEEMVLRYEGAALSVPVPAVLSPAVCVPYLVRSVTEGYLLEYGAEMLDGLDCVRAAFDPTAPDGSTVLCTVWFETETLAPRYTEFSTDGAVVLTIRTLSFTMKEKEG